MRNNASASAPHRRIRRPPLSGKQSTTPSTRRERRAAERHDRFEAARDDRQAKSSGSGGGGSSWINAKTMTVIGIAAGVLIVAFVAIGQLGGKTSGKFEDPGLVYAAAIVDGHNLGAADAPVTMDVYEDYQCPICAKYSLTVEPSLVNQYVIPGKLRIVHHDIGILGRPGAENESELTAAGAYCANEQDRYWDYAHWVYINQDGENVGGFNRDRLTKIAVAAGLDEPTFKSCLDSDPAKQAVAAANAESVSLGINSTPTIYIGGQQIVGLKTAAELGALIDAELAKGSGTPAASPSTNP